MSATNYLEEAVLKHVLNIASMTSPAAVYLAVGTNAPNEDGSWTGEISANGYKRQLIEFTEPELEPTEVACVISNACRIRFAQATANWGTISHFAIVDSITGGNILEFDALTSSIDINLGDTLSFDGGAIDVQYAHDAGEYLLKKMLNHVFRHESFTAPTSFYVACCKTTPTVPDTGSSIDEPSGNNYSRVQQNSWNSPTQVSGKARSTNNGAVNFNQATGDWGTINSFALCDAGTGGNLLYFTDTDVSVVDVLNGDTAYFGDTAIRIELD